MKSVKDTEDRVIKIARTLVRYCDEAAYHRLNGNLDKKVERQIDKLVDRCADLSNMRLDHD